jgi:DNA topoisomerase-1
MPQLDSRSVILEKSRNAAKSAGLVYVSDDTPGITRKRVGKTFHYFAPGGTRIKDEETLYRIRLLAIPPAWVDVWISPSERGHIQAVGRDQRHRKQYRYHAKWREVRDESKYGRLLEFARALPALRRRVRRDLSQPGLPREKVLAAVVAVMEKTFIRIGNDEYAKSNNSFGLTTLRDRHARISRGGKKVVFEFRGKSGKDHAIELNDPRLGKIISASQDLPGQELFQYLDNDGNVRDIGSADVNAYLREITGKDFTAKDFRTWAGTVLAAEALRELATFDSNAQAKRNIVSAVERVASRLGNTKAVCRKCYIHPEVFNAYLDQSMIAAATQRSAEMAKDLSKLKPEEAAVVTLLRRRLVESRSSSRRKPRAAARSKPRQARIGPRTRAKSR